MIRSVKWMVYQDEIIGPFGIIEDVFKILLEPDKFPLHMYGAQLSKNHGDLLDESEDRLPACGVGSIPSHAKTSAIAEAIERYSLITWHPSSESVSDYGTVRSELEGYDFPISFPPSFKVSRVSTQTMFRESRFCYPQVYSKRIPVPVGLLTLTDDFIGLQSSNGMAAGNSLTEAALYALYEVIERDTLMLAWYREIRGIRLNPFQYINDNLAHVLVTNNMRTVHLRCCYYISDFNVPVFLTAFIEGSLENPLSVSLGSACSLNIRSGIERSIKEAILSWHGSRDLISQKGRIGNKQIEIKNFSDHLLYCHNSKQAKLVTQWICHSSDMQLDQLGEYSDEEDDFECLTKRITENGFEFLIFDMTPEEISQTNLGLKVARAIVPGTIPLSVGNWNVKWIKRMKTPPDFIVGEYAQGKKHWVTRPHPFP